jgi:hypothetical protein
MPDKEKIKLDVLTLAHTHAMEKFSHILHACMALKEEPDTYLKVIDDFYPSSESVFELAKKYETHLNS